MTDRDDSSNLKKESYQRIYNILMFIIVNINFCKFKVDAEQKREVSEIHDLMNKVSEVMLKSPFENYFEKLYLLESGYLNEQLIKEVYDEFEATEDLRKHTFFEFDYNSPFSEFTVCRIALQKVEA